MRSLRPAAIVLASFTILMLAPLESLHGVGDGVEVCVLFFYSPTCELCHRADEILEGLESRLPKLKVHRLNVLDRGNMHLMLALEETSGVPIGKRGLIPAIYVGGVFFLGEGDIEYNATRVLANLDNAPCPPQLPQGEGGLQSALQRLESFTVPAIVSAALVDSLNPCSLSILILLLSLLAASGRGKGLLIAGGLFTLGVFSAYTLLGFGILAAVQAISYVVRGLIYPSASIITFSLGCLNLFDYIRLRKGGSLDRMAIRLPRVVVDKSEHALRFLAEHKYVCLVSPFVGFGVSFLEFMCTGQIYLPTIVYVAGIPDLRARATAYLLLYNAVYIVPLLIVIATSYIAASPSYFGMMRQLRSRAGALKALTAAIFFALSVMSAVLAVQLNWDGVQEIGPEVGIVGCTDRSIYRASDMINASIEVNCSAPIKGAEIAIYGIRNSEGLYLVNTTIREDLAAGVSRFNVLLSMPYCLQCVKLNPGQNTVVFELRSRDAILAKAQVGIEIAP